MIDFRLKTFIDLCETKSYTKTAKRLCITQPAVSQHIKYIESQYNIKSVLEEIKNKELVVLDVDSMNLSHEFNFIFLKESIYADEYIEFYNKIN